MGLQNWYDAHVMPRLVTFACSQGQIMKRRSFVVPLARGNVLELGCGGGLNQQFYDTDAISQFAGIDPHAGLLDQARKAGEARGWTTDIREGVGEEIPFASSQFDTVVCTYTLCSVHDPAQVLSEVRRVLKPGGQMLFLEHGRAPDANVAKWQMRIEPVWKRIAGGCHLTRPIGSALRGAGFDVEPMGQGYMPKTPRIAGWMEWGVARKTGA
ncbi:class I SAM-dependent methyltransferase [Altererythrobacter sp. GH1-8]|uniref:class I SAM-dependent methyltransferase n=1 Tax=Altererythrobacter sp. GH1-8 TaxID=3349333 RepID=UPI00374DBBB0